MYNCKRLANISNDKRGTFFKEKRLCFNCAGKHRAFACKEEMHCVKCKPSDVVGIKHMNILHDYLSKKHSRISHKDLVETSSTQQNTADNISDDDVNVKIRNVSILPTRVLSRVIAARIVNPHNGASNS